jgi:hypothetical protein
LGRVAPQVQQSNEPSNEPPRSLDQGAATAEAVPETSSSSEGESTTEAAAPEPARPEPEQSIEPEVALEVAEVEDTPEPSEGDEALTGVPEPRTPTSRASFVDRDLSWPSSSSKIAGQKKKKKKKKGKKG